MNEGIIGTLILWVIGLVVYAIYNLYKKNVKLEIMLEQQSTFNSDVIGLLDEFNALVNKIDMTIWVQSDPEIRALFDNIKEVQKIVQEFTGRK
jgi:uncharacterized protein YoxC